MSTHFIVLISHVICFANKYVPLEGSSSAIIKEQWAADMKRQAIKIEKKTCIKKCGVHKKYRKTSRLKIKDMKVRHN